MRVVATAIDDSSVSMMFHPGPFRHGARDGMVPRMSNPSRLFPMLAMTSAIACGGGGAPPPTAPAAAPRILLVLTSHDQLGATGKKTGAYLAEVAHPYQVFTARGFAVDFASPKGGRPPFDGLDQIDAISQRFLDDTAVQARLEHTLRPADVDPAQYAAIVYAGGHGTVWDFPGDAGLAAVARSIYERGGVVAAVCHGPAALVNLTLSDGSYLVAGKEVAAFTNSEETAVGLDQVVPFLLADELVKRGAIHRPAADWQPQVVVSDRLVTGQNPQSATGVAEAVAALLAR
jgi:putative intracellular protease/amidase